MPSWYKTPIIGFSTAGIFAAMDANQSFSSESSMTHRPISMCSTRSGAIDSWRHGLWRLNLNMINGGAEGNRTVSYTHLRAHETRHDLVCRLLLEKKKNYHN